MLRNRRWAILVIAVLPLAGCAETLESSAAAKSEPAKVEKIQGTELSRLRLEAKAAERLDLQTEEVALLPGSGADGARTTIPYAALLYDSTGATFVYTSPEPLVFVRHPVTVESIQGDRVTLREGPPVGTVIVTAGGAELTGVEFGVGK
jgi:hypothetical protein